MRLFSLQQQQVIATDMERAWRFISNARNLDRITPPEMDFEIMTDLPDRIYNGLLIEYRVKVPPFGHQAWLSELKYVDEGRSFVDEQRAGPYRFWYHYHAIEPCTAGVRFTDRIYYAMPFGPLGRIAHQLFVRQKLKHIFDYRHRALIRLFGDAPPDHFAVPSADPSGGDGQPADATLRH